MTSRVSASILTACFLQELICDNITDFENLAVTLGKEMIKINTFIHLPIITHYSPVFMTHYLLYFVDYNLFINRRNIRE